MHESPHPCSQTLVQTALLKHPPSPPPIPHAPRHHPPRQEPYQRHKTWRIVAEGRRAADKLRAVRVICAAASQRNIIWRCEGVRFWSSRFSAHVMVLYALTAPRWNEDSLIGGVTMIDGLRSCGVVGRRRGRQTRSLTRSRSPTQSLCNCIALHSPR
jgi:hypothetical protein